jgi:hypothetical protein
VRPLRGAGEGARTMAASLAGRRWPPAEAQLLVERLRDAD